MRVTPIFTFVKKKTCLKPFQFSLIGLLSLVLYILPAQAQTTGSIANTAQTETAYGNATDLYAVEFPLDSLLAARVDSIAKAEAGRQDIIGMSLAVIRQGAITYVRSYGYSDWENQIPVTPYSEFRWASMSKSLTAIAAMKLQEAGLLQIDTPVKDYLPYWQDSTVRLRHLLQNRSGVGHYNEMDKLHPSWKHLLKSYKPDSSWHAEAAVRVFKDAPLVFPADSGHLYSTFGFVLAGAVVDQVGQTQLGKGYLDLVQDFVIQPLGLSSLRPDYFEDKNPLEVKGYYKDKKGDLRARKDDDVTWKIPGGGYASNVIDLAKYIQGLIQYKLLLPESYTELWTPQSDWDYAMGFEVKQDGFERLVNHTGSQNKTRTVFAFYPETGLGVVIMCNTEWANPREVAIKLLDSLKPKPETSVLPTDTQRK